MIELLIGFVQGVTIECLGAKDDNFHMQSSDKILRAPLPPRLTPTEAGCRRYATDGFRNKLFTLPPSLKSVRLVCPYGGADRPRWSLEWAGPKPICGRLGQNSSTP
jgi:hypothetical protein